MQAKSKQITMAYFENTTTIKPKDGNSTYLCGMKDKNETEFDAIIDELRKEQLPPYTMEEIYAMIDEAQRDFEAGKFYTTEEVFQEIEEEINKLRHKSAESVC